VVVEGATDVPGPHTSAYRTQRRKVADDAAHLSAPTPDGARTKGTG
jgi:hypothetical protein